MGYRLLVPEWHPLGINLYEYIAEFCNMKGQRFVEVKVHNGFMQQVTFTVNGKGYIINIRDLIGSGGFYIFEEMLIARDGVSIMVRL